MLDPRLKTCVEIVLTVKGKTARQIFGSPDDLKLRSSLTLFAQVAPREPVFRQALEKYYAEQPDARTLELQAVADAAKVSTAPTAAEPSER